MPCVEEVISMLWVYFEKKKGKKNLLEKSGIECCLLDNNMSFSFFSVQGQLLAYVRDVTGCCLMDSYNIAALKKENYITLASKNTNSR